ncbi:NAD-glutamate dehydrogenase [Zafaria cholistanensis]|uniref:NAD-glutamate dehydrogenase n=1 Tax=Zafaria cholistanensis TaxID=1682741 RepID=A0A5A7NVV1_9MICC|nr:NAD-glutamate dehydrogenase [Zafaria cholistanensis]GER24358.1 NAD-glutamate dehydrogenase [Zafaria cholistanensis]
MSTGSRTPDQFIADILSPDFVETYYGHLAPEDAAAYPPGELEARVEAHLHAGLIRDPGEAVVRVEPSGANAVVYVVTDDMPFLVDSVTAEIVRQKHGINLVVHPILVANRSRETHELTALRAVPTHAPVASGDTAALGDLSQYFGDGSQSRLESWIAIEIGGSPDEERIALLVAGIERILADVKVCVEDWEAMRNKAHEIADNLGWVRGADSIPDLHTASDLLRWLDDGNFTFLGYREYDLVTEKGQDVLRARQESSLGLMRRSVGGGVQHLTESGRAKARERRALIITKANSRSTVHRPVYLDYVGIKSFDAQGNVNGERRFIGLFASGAYTRSVRSVPVVRDKVDAVLKASGFAPDSHSGKDLLTILETYPRDELFQTEVQDLHEIVTGMLALQERRRTTVFVRPDVYGRFMSAFVFLPRDRYTTSVRLRIEEELRKVYDAESMDFEVRMSESSLVRLFYRIRLRRRGDFPAVDRADLERRLERAVRSWAEGIDQVVRGRYPADQAPAVSRRWAEAFPPAYRVHFEVEDALEDIARFGAYDDPAHRGPVLRVYLPKDGDAEEDARLKLYLTEPVSLSHILPVLHNLGLRVLDEKPFEVSRGDGRTFFLYDLGLFYPEGVDPLRTEALLSEAWAAVALDRAESDPFDRLVLKEGMHWRQVAVLRAYTKYLRQLGVPNSYGFVADTVLANPAVARALVTLFESLFDPALDEAARAQALKAARTDLAAGLEQVPTLDADRLLRRLAEVIEATLRTNHYQGADHLAFKLDPSRIDSAPFPRPKYEIWVYSPRVEGVHLRFGDVARGGLRWSDRREDFRTEVLGLVKAQVVKNAVIVPTGAKGGFFAKRLPDPAADRAAWMAEGQAAYRIFIRALLDLTDNLVAGPDGETVVPPRDVVRRDGDDTYLVVAADKGTASFSDIANSISLETGHWLGDAFASGGSIGYDHKAMGITARGAWESVRRHFFELGLDTQAQDFTVVGIGDMSGDVFGNGMLLSRHVRLVAAFDHRHIFLDPDPDPEASFDERKRLFDLPRSSWADYDASLISEGGGVYPRSAKSVPVSDAVRRALGLPEGTVRLSPPELLRAILTAPVDLLYNGGIGTYVKASTETHTQVGDRANDAIRVDGRDLRARVVGEGGNLGMTQLGRVEAALAGVLLNTDAIDNSAGVDCSDHEVNIKILVDRMVKAGRLDAAERAGFLQAMTDDVARLVLRTNIDQNVLLLNEKQRLAEWSPSFERFMDWLEVAADLDRNLEFLPDNAELESRLARGQVLTAPELSVLVAYAKIQLSRALADSDLHEDPYFEDTLVRYFPEQVAERFGADVQSHPLRREIIATVVANDMVNLGGITYAFRVMEETGAAEPAVARAFVALREIYDLDGFTADVLALPAGFPTDKWCRMQLDQRRLLDRATRWLINHSEKGRTVGEDIAAYRDTVAGLRAELGTLLRGCDADRTVAWKAEALGWGAPEDVANRWAVAFESFSLLDVARLAAETGQPARDVAAVYYAVFDRFGVDSLLERITKLPRQDRWQALARAALRDDLYSTVVDIARAAMEAAPDTADPLVRLDAWGERNAEGLERAMNMFDEVSRLERDDMASLAVALRLLRSIVRR